MSLVQFSRRCSTLPMRASLIPELSLSGRRSGTRQNPPKHDIRISDSQSEPERRSKERSMAGPMPPRRSAILYLFMLLLAFFGSASSFVIPLSEEHACPSDIYCYGDILHTIQMAHIFDDSKHFVDMPLRYSPETIKQNFEDLMTATGQHPDDEQLRAFVFQNFDEPGTDTEKHDPEDWSDSPAFLDKIQNNKLKQWAEHLHGFWKNLSLKVIDNVKEEPERYSIIHVPNPVIVPGDRFREFYYWDSYWTMKGLLLSEMYDTVRGMLENFLGMVEEFGFVPNGGRIYYTQRSQPPFLIPMMNEYVKTTRDEKFLRNHIETLEKEYAFWNLRRSVEITIDGKPHKLARYDVEGVGPRPESYYEDVQTASVFQEEADRQSLYRDLKTGAESGWDFSTRWYIKDGTNEGALSDTKARSIVPVDLNSILCYNARILAHFYDILNDNDKADFYRREADLRDEAVNHVLWDEEAGVWLDYDLENEMRRPYFYLSNLNPLWTHCYETVMNQEERLDRVIQYIHDLNILEFPAGVPTSLLNSTQQWDLPNAWAPIIHMLIEGLQSIDRADAKQMAFNTAQTWIRTMYNAYERSGHMFEKYNVITGAGGGGGEYNVQLGFGWTNGVALDFLSQYGDRLLSEVPTRSITPRIIEVPESKTDSKKPSTFLVLWACLATILGGTGLGIGIWLLKNKQVLLQETVVDDKGRKRSLVEILDDKPLLMHRNSFYGEEKSY